jgi:hypothetical protein
MALGQADLDPVAVLVHPNRDRLPQRAPPRVGPRPGERRGAVEGVAADHGDLGQAGPVRVAGHPDLAHVQDDGDLLGRLGQRGRERPGGQPDQQPIPSRDKGVLDDPGDAVAGGGQAGIAAGGRPAAPHPCPMRHRHHAAAHPGDGQQPRHHPGHHGQRRTPTKGASQPRPAPQHQ